MKNKFFGSKFNIILLLVLIILLIFCFLVIELNSKKEKDLILNVEEIEDPTNPGHAIKPMSGQRPFEDVAMESFFQDLNEKNYDKAIPLYDGDYDFIRGWNPDVSYYDYGTLWKHACEMNGLNCLKVKDIVKKEILIPKDVFGNDELGEWRSKENKYDLVFKYTVRYQKEDGALFEIGPCCGEEDSGQRVTEFEVLVGKQGSNFFIITPPPYTP